MVPSVQPYQQTGTVGRTRVAPALFALAITVLALLLRLYHFDMRGLRLDEVWSVWMAQRDVSAIIDTILVQRVDATPPLYYILLHGTMSFGHDLLAIRIVSILAGTAIVWLTFWLAAFLFDLRVARVSALLLAIAPLHVEYSQVARAYTLAGFWSLLSLFCFAHMVFGTRRRIALLGFVLATTGALYTHYLTGFVVLAELTTLALLWWSRAISWRQVGSSIVGLAITAVCLIPVITIMFTRARPGGGQAWLTPPVAADAVKSIILFGTGDPSMGTTGFTLPRLLSLGVLTAIGMLTLWELIQHWGNGKPEALRVAAVLCALVVPLVVAFALSQVRPLYKEKYFLFVMPPLSLLIGWTLVRARPRLLSMGLAAILVGLTGLALSVHVRAPVGEEWREAAQVLERDYRAGDLVVLSPGYYSRPLMFYRDDAFPPDTHALGRSPVVLMRNGTYSAMGKDDADAFASDASAGTVRVWLITGDVPPHQAVTNWAKQYTVREETTLLGVRVRLLERQQ